jgi:type III secretion protein L
MTFATLLAKDRIAVGLGSTILGPDELLDVMSSVALLESCEKSCAAERVASDEHRLAQERLGYADGFARANAQFAEKLAQTEAGIADFWTAQEDRLAALVAAVLHRLAPALSAPDLIRELVTKAVQEVREERWLVVRVHPDNVTATRQALEGLKAEYPHLANIEASANLELGMSDCIIESPNGFVNASWPVQVNALKNVFQSFAVAAVKEREPARKTRARAERKTEAMKTGADA